MLKREMSADRWLLVTKRAHYKQLNIWISTCCFILQHFDIYLCVSFIYLFYYYLHVELLLRC